MHLRWSITNAIYGIHIDVIFLFFFVALLTAFSVGISNASGAWFLTFIRDVQLKLQKVKMQSGLLIGLRQSKCCYVLNYCINCSLDKKIQKRAKSRGMTWGAVTLYRRLVMFKSTKVISVNCLSLHFLKGFM